MRNNNGRAQMAAAGIVLCLAPIAWSTGVKSPAEGRIVRFGISSAVMEADVNPDDALAATKIWASSAGTGTWTESDARVFHDIPSLVTAVNNGETDIIALSTQEYLTVEGSLHADPAMVYMQSGQVELEYVVLVRQDSGFKSPADLRGRKLVTVRAGRSCMVPLWLDALLSDNGLPAKESFFKEIKEVAKASQVVLPVFFRQVEAGVVIRSAFDTAVTLNPQIGQQLKVMTTSPRLVPALVCFRSALPAEQKARYLDKSLRLHESPSGLQTFNVLKLDRLIRWEPRYSDTVKDLMRKQKLSRSKGTGIGEPVSAAWEGGWR
jgi:ABC-type phosphate/phosphonate transport system substrate-binding protein